MTAVKSSSTIALPADSKMVRYRCSLLRSSASAARRFVMSVLVPMYSVTVPDASTTG